MGQVKSFMKLNQQFNLNRDGEKFEYREITYILGFFLILSAWTDVESVNVSDAKTKIDY